MGHGLRRRRRGARLWKSVAGSQDDRIQNLGKDSNYWSTGQPGPAGPCSEIFFDRGPSYGIDGGPATDDDRYVEIWNLVFMQYAIQNVRSKVDFDIVGELPKKNIDTGMGMERVAFIKQGVDNMYEIDQVRPVLDAAVALSGRKYGADHTDDVRFRVIADHVRSSLMLMTDGVAPGNEGRGYILRRLMRRAIRSMRLLGVDAPSFAELFDASRVAMRDAYPDVEENWDRTSRLALGEEETFLSTLVSGTTILDTAVAETKKAGAKVLPGDTTFLLHDTFGFPVDLTLEIAEEAGLTVDREAFDKLMTEQRTRAKTDAKAKKGAIADVGVYSDLRSKGETVFTGYDTLQTETTVLGILVDGVPVTKATAGQTAEVIVAESSLYAESGGQAADQGSIIGNGFDLEVLDVQRPVKGLISHTVKVRSGEVAVDAVATTVVDPLYRHAAAQAHSATHLVHAALRETLGSEAHQSGSFNKAGYMRLDFAWNQALSPATRSEIEEISNNAVRDNLEVTTRILSLDEAKASGAMALFGEKYGDVVRVVDIGDGSWSRELCAGIHVRSSAEVGIVNLVSESSVGSTNRRVEALVGLDAFRDLTIERAIVGQLTSALKVPRDQIADRVATLAAELKAAEKKIAAFEASKLLGARSRSRRERDSGRRVPDRRRRPRRTLIGRRAAIARDDRARAPRFRRRRRGAGRAHRWQAVGDRRDEPGCSGCRSESRSVSPSRRRRPSAVAAAAKTTSLRAAAATWQRSARRSTASPQRCDGRSVRPGVRLGVDVGKARVGIASSDRDGLLATPVATLARQDADERSFGILVEQYGPVEIVVGLPLSLSGADTASTTDAREFAAEVAEWDGCPCDWSTNGFRPCRRSALCATRGDAPRALVP